MKMARKKCFCGAQYTRMLSTKKEKIPKKNTNHKQLKKIKKTMDECDEMDAMRRLKNAGRALAEDMHMIL
jgi:hypothetical protein